MEFYSKAESMSREELEKLQSERLIKTVRRVYEKVPFYKKNLMRQASHQKI